MSGLNSARKLVANRKKYLRPRSTRFSTFPTLKGVVLSPLQKEAKQPSSGNRMCWRVTTRIGNIIAYSPLDGIRNMIKVHDTVTVSSIGGSNGRSMGDIPGARFKIVKIGRMPVKELFKGTRTV